MSINYKDYNFFDGYLSNEDMNSIVKQAGNDKTLKKALQCIKKHHSSPGQLDKEIYQILLKNSSYNFFNRLNIKIYRLILLIQLYMDQKKPIGIDLKLSELLYKNYRSLWNDKQFVTYAVQYKGHNLGHASKDLQNDLEVVKKAIEKNGRNLEYASEAMKNNKEIVTIAVENEGTAIQFASLQIKGDLDVALKAIRQNGRSIEHISSGLRKQRVFVLHAVENHDRAIESIPKEFYNDVEIMSIAVNQKTSNLRFAPVELRSTEDFMAKFISRDPLSFDYVMGGLEKNEKLIDQVVTSLVNRCTFILSPKINLNFKSKLNNSFWVDINNKLIQEQVKKIDCIKKNPDVLFKFY